MGLFIFCTFFYTLQITKVQAAGGYLIKAIESLSAGTDAKMICKEQQDSSSDVFNVYTDNGRMCSAPLAGAFAEVVCPGVDADYNSSTCHQIALAILHTEDPKLALPEQIGKLPRKSKEGICAKAASVSPIFAQTIKEVCTQSPEAAPKIEAKGALKSTEKAYTAKVTKYEEKAGALAEITEVNATTGNPSFKGKLVYVHPDTLKRMTGTPLNVGSIISFDKLNPETFPNPLKKDAFFIVGIPVQLKNEKKK